MIELIVGLGNPGQQYARNRHNVGFMAAEAIARRHNFSGPQEKFKGLLWDGVIGGKKLRLFEPMTYMNNSGIPLSELASFFKIAPHNVAVFYDELDIPLGKIRIKQGGGHNGHNGLKSIDAHMGVPYHRVRLGIGRPDRGDVTGWVLGNFDSEQQIVVDRLTDVLADHADLLVAKNFQGYMNKAALLMQPVLDVK